jgi:hypothetical protein
VTNASLPVVNIDKNNVTEIYKGGEITGLSIDDFKGILFIADSTQNKVIIYVFDKETIKTNN